MASKPSTQEYHESLKSQYTVKVLSSSHQRLHRAGERRVVQRASHSKGTLYRYVTGQRGSKPCREGKGNDTTGSFLFQKKESHKYILYSQQVNNKNGLTLYSASSKPPWPGCAVAGLDCWAGLAAAAGLGLATAFGAWPCCDWDWLEEAALDRLWPAPWSPCSSSLLRIVLRSRSP
ncbi:4-hydroxy-2-oxovalerate aldolase 1 [Frankliniella fusca]|uniref:4-hydroxy-2-oxovalerate aldolase 1 n=1 Tax=Frankliniella fusca TaxID=407009 RepID=A0AAE1HVD2_9NEOP|nr:4-hydroxy-2-oxovalerate aldolase 1 [Frankliniella fusca]